MSPCEVNRRPTSNGVPDVLVHADEDSKGDEQRHSVPRAQPVGNVIVVGASNATSSRY